MKQFKARIEFKNAENIHAIEVWMQADGIIQAGGILLNYFQPLAVGGHNVTKLIEMQDNRPDTYGWGYPTCDRGHPTRTGGEHIHQSDYEEHCSP